MSLVLPRLLHTDVPCSAERINAPKIYPLETLVQPIALRFKYHFEGTRGTNRVDKVRLLGGDFCIVYA